MNKKYHGIIPPIVSPVDADENIDEKGFRELIEYCIKGGPARLFGSGNQR